MPAKFCFSLILGGISFMQAQSDTFDALCDPVEFYFVFLLWFEYLIMHIGLISSSMQSYKLQYLAQMIFIYYLCNLTELWS